MAKSFALLVDECESELQDSANATWTAVELAIQLEKAIKEVSEYVPYTMLVRFEIESRTGTATSTTANKLVDSQGQFLSTDVGKVIYNTTDHTWATVSAYDSATTLSLTGNIMVSGEGYEMFNEGCRSNKEVYIGDVTDYIGEDHGVLQDDRHATEYPLGTKRNVSINGNVLTLLMDVDPDDSADADANVDVFVWFKVSHRVSQLTDLAGEIDGGTLTAGATTIHIDGLQATVGVFAEDTLFTIENCRGTYRATADATIGVGTSECDVNIFPGLEDAIVDGADVTIIGSTLDRRLERLVVEITVARATLSKTMALLSEGHNAIVVLTTINTTIGNMSAGITQAINDLNSGRTEVAKTVDLIADANTALGKVDIEVTKSLFDRDTGRVLIDQINVGGNVSADYANYASSNIQSARGYLEEAVGYLRQATADESVGSSYGASAIKELNMANSYLTQAGGYIQRISAGLSIAQTGKLYREEGQNRLTLVLRELEGRQPVAVRQTYSRL